MKKGVHAITKQLSVLAPHYRECSLKLLDDVEWMLFLGGGGEWRTAGNVPLLGKPKGQFGVRQLP